MYFELLGNVWFRRNQSVLRSCLIRANPKNMFACVSMSSPWSPTFMALWQGVQENRLSIKAITKTHPEYDMNRRIYPVWWNFRYIITWYSCTHLSLAWRRNAHQPGFFSWVSCSSQRSITIRAEVEAVGELGLLSWDCSSQIIVNILLIPVASCKQNGVNK